MDGDNRGVPADLREALVRHVRDVHDLFQQGAPTADEEERALDRSLREAGSIGRLREVVEACRLHEISGVRLFNIEMDLLNKCNYRCVMCMLSHPSVIEQPMRRFSIERFEQLAQEVFWHTAGLSFTYGAEPLLHPDFARFVEIAARYRIPRVYCVTNGSLLTEEVAEAAVRHGMHAITVSVDAARRETYESIRVGGDWNVLMHNLRTLQRKKRELGSERPRLELTFVMMRNNVRELPDFITLAHELGASAVSTVHMLPFEQLGTASESCSRIKETTNAVLRRTRELARRLGVELSTPPLFGEPPPENQAAAGAERFCLPATKTTLQAGHCPFPWHFVAIDMKGDVVPCGWWQGGMPMGNIHDQSFLSIWNGDRYRQLRREHRTGALCPTCRRCPAAGMGKVDDAAAFEAR